ncbi:hypothetical protein T492DRAFT_893809 [Pavlovales sp. CCMP2436]|nr:hypothetical protein T492DRAFT_893809 [Pavlovales sp. CCMP2436]
MPWRRHGAMLSAAPGGIIPAESQPTAPDAATAPLCAPAADGCPLPGRLSPTAPPQKLAEAAAPPVLLPLLPAPQPSLAAAGCAL